MAAVLDQVVIEDQRGKFAYYLTISHAHHLSTCIICLINCHRFNGYSNEPECPICGTYEYPGNPDEYIQARYVGEFSCGQFYDRGLHGLIPAFMCGPLQNFA